jgi:hypothetical protein
MEGIIRDAINKGKRPRLAKSGQTVLPTPRNEGRGRGCVILSRRQGQETPAGALYRQLQGVEGAPDEQFDYSIGLTKVGASEFATTRAGSKVRIRTLQPNGKFSYTNAGKQFMRHKFTESLVEIRP